VDPATFTDTRRGGSRVSRVARERGSALVRMQLIKEHKF